MRAIELNNIGLTLEGKKILDSVSFDVDRGSIFGLVGYNGAGKTSLLRIILGLNPHYDGLIRFFEDDDIMMQRQKIGTVIDSLNLDLSCNAEEYLCRIGRLHNGFDKKKISELLEIVGLNDVHKKKIHKYSMGMKRRLSLATALLGKPDLLILDEPFNGIDIEGMNELRLILQELAMEGITILVTSHIIPELIKLSNTFGVLHQGKFIGALSKKELSLKKHNKLTIKVNDARHFSQDMKIKYPEVCCVSSYVGTVSLLGQDYASDYKGLLEQYHVHSGDIVQEIMDEEEHLLYMMSGNSL